MKKLLSNSRIIFIGAGIIFFSCSNCGIQEKATSANATGMKSGQDTTLKTSHVMGKPVPGQQTNQEKQGRDTISHHKTVIMNNDQNQSVTDSIKAAKTKKKK